MGFNESIWLEGLVALCDCCKVKKFSYRMENQTFSKFKCVKKIFISTETWGSRVNVTVEAAGGPESDSVIKLVFLLIFTMAGLLLSRVPVRTSVPPGTNDGSKWSVSGCFLVVHFSPSVHTFQGAAAGTNLIPLPYYWSVTPDTLMDSWTMLSSTDFMSGRSLMMTFCKRNSAPEMFVLCLKGHSRAAYQ